MKKKFVAWTLSLVFCFGNGSLLGIVEEKLAIQFNTVISMIVAKILVHRHTLVKMNIKHLRLSRNSIKDKVFNKYSSRKILPAFLKT